MPVRVTRTAGFPATTRGQCRLRRLTEITWLHIVTLVPYCATDSVNAIGSANDGAPDGTPTRRCVVTRVARRADAHVAGALGRGRGDPALVAARGAGTRDSVER